MPTIIYIIWIYCYIVSWIRYAAVGVKIEGLVAFPWIIGLPELVSENDVTIVAFGDVFVALTKMPGETCKVEIFVSAFVKSATH